ncbi:hypothetical protein Ahy_A01g003201 [Arachis hypogaea]|uniref:Protein FAR1-RELATED SEQUENCE n=1 Tax=Arachis hypogaea TaxID=3818 RepID=A0A445ESE3_ARAHY|nr:hypothetical protein Ahy_A01g003201 [Arachis hypogaea]
MQAFYGGFLHCKSGLVQFVHEYNNVLGNKEQKELEGDAANSKGKVFWKKPVYHIFIVEYDPLSQKCKKFGSTGLLCCHTLPVWSYYKVDIVPSCYVLPRWSKNVIRKHTYVKSSHDVAQTNESHNLFRDLCSEFYNIAQEFIGCDEEVAILQSAIWDAKSKLNDYCASMRSTTLAATQNTMATQGTSDAIEHDIQGPLRVKTKGRLKTKRLGAELDKLIKKAMQKKKRKLHLDVVDLQTDNEHHGLVNEIFKDSTT